MPLQIGHFFFQIQYPPGIVVITHSFLMTHSAFNFSS